MLYLLIFTLLLLFFVQIVTSVSIPLPGKPVYIPSSNTIWIFSFAKASQTSNILASIDLNKSFNTLNPPANDVSYLINNDHCPIMHFAQAEPDFDGLSVNIFGAGSYSNGTYSPTMSACQFNTSTQSWSELVKPNTPLARRNAVFETTTTGQTIIWGGSSEVLTGLPTTNAQYPIFWHNDVSIYDHLNGWLQGPNYSGTPRSNATITQIQDTNGQLVVVGGTISADPGNYTNYTLVDMSNIILFDPRTQNWNNINATGNIPPPRLHHTTTLHPDGRTLVVIGGENFNASGGFVLNDVYLLDTINWNWKAAPLQSQGLARSNHSSILINDQIWVIAGTNSTNKAVDIQLLNLTDWSWSYQHVSNVTDTSDRYASIGGTKGLVGIILGVTLPIILLVACLTAWCIKRKRNQRQQQQQLSNILEMKQSSPIFPSNNHRQSYQTNNIIDELQVASKIQPTQLHTDEWLSNHYRHSYELSPNTPGSPFYADDSKFPSAAATYEYNNANNIRQSMNYWEDPSYPYQNAQQQEGPIILRPLAGSNHAQTGAQQHQKPNEADNPTPEASTTVYTLSSRGEEDPR